ncbi:MAG: hypothetical protein JNL18_03570 [Planctomycetaceae bacterium]|nr:hypothetical protein [Planctomycetaceae bacterium]
MMRTHQRWWTIGGGLLGVTLLSVAAFNYCRCYCGAPVRLTLSGGNVCPLRTEMAQRIAAGISGHVEVNVCSGTNSEQICHAVDAGELDLGLILGGLPTAQYRNVRQVATLGVEPLHLLVRRELLENDPTPSLEILRGRRVSIGEPGANGTRLAEDLLQLAGLMEDSADESPEFVAERHAASTLLNQVLAWRAAAGAEQTALRERLPDAAFVVDSMPSELVDQLVRDGEYGLVPLPFATALHLDSRRNHSGERVHLRNDRVEAVSIPAFAYGIQPATPSQDCETIGLRLMLVANKDVSTSALFDALRSMTDAVAAHTRVNLDVTNANPEFPVHPGSDAFLRARRPLNLNEILGPTTDALSVAGATIAGCLALWSFVRGLRAVQPDVHLRQIDRIERLLQGHELDESAPTLPGEFLEYLESRLSQVKQKVIEDYANGRLDGDDALIGILTLVADTRHLLTERRKLLADPELGSGRLQPQNLAAA